MTQTNFANNFGTFNAPPQQSDDLPILTLFKECYLLWYNFLPHLPRLTRYTLGVKIDNLFIEILEITAKAKYARREDKLDILKKLSDKFDNLKFFITLLWEAKGLNAKQYSQLAQKLSTIGKMLGKWLQMFDKKETPAV